MVHIEITIDDIDYDALIEQYLPEMTEKLREAGNPVAMLLSTGMSSSMARNTIKKMPQEEKDKLAADIINQYSVKLSRGAEDFASQQGINTTVVDLKASKQ